MPRLTEYLTLAREYPHLFKNRRGGITILLNPAEIVRAEAAVAARLRETGKPAAWADVGIVYEDQYTMMVRDAVRFPDGSYGTYIRSVSTADYPPGLVVVARHEGRFLVLRHFRHHDRNWHWEFIRGTGERGVPAIETARTELREEIAAEVTDLRPLGRIEGAEVFQAELVAYGAPDQQEAIAEIRAVTESEFETMVRKNQVTDLYTLAAYARYCLAQSSAPAQVSDREQTAG